MEGNSKRQNPFTMSTTRNMTFIFLLPVLHVSKDVAALNMISVPGQGHDLVRSEGVSALIFGNGNQASRPSCEAGSAHSLKYRNGKRRIRL